MRPRRTLTWVIFAVCILAVLEGLGWVTWHALRLERAEREARAAAQFQQSIRLALWRMESEITPIIAAESARPYFHYMSFYPAERAYTKMWQQVKPNEVQVPSPLLESSGPYIHLHFQIESDGRITSPQAPTGNQRDLAEGQQYVDSEFIVLAAQMLEELTAIVHEPDSAGRPLHRTLSTLPEPSITPPPAQVAQPDAQVFAMTGQQQQAEGPVQLGQISSKLDEIEYQARVKAAETAQTLNAVNERRNVRGSDRADRKQVAPKPEEPPTDTEGSRLVDKSVYKKEAPVPAPSLPAGASPSLGAAKDSTSPGWKAAEPDRAAESPEESNSKHKASLLKDYQAAGPATEQIKVDQGPFVAMWRPNPRSGAAELLLTRSVLIEGTRTVQGLWFDWAQLRERLIANTKDLLPAATLSPALDGENDAGGQRLAAIPVRLLPGPVPPLTAAILTPTHVTLGVTWAAVLGAIVAIAVVLRTAMELSERRGRFVSAVTHELRTPLTTFCLYTEMLSSGMVKDDEARKQYLGTLHRESGRLARIVQNVLDYAGIGGVGRRTPGPAPVVPLPDLLARLTPALQQCADQAGMRLVAEHEGIDGAAVRADPQTVERILLNLVENAGKYASEAEDRRVHFCVRRHNEGISLSIRDHGPGIVRGDRRRVFRAFQRGARDTHGPKSGLGLGLALARELASELGGRLSYQSSQEPGALFALHLPIASIQSTN